jgi:asparagine synthetase B (glutamine-hydrolysing)
MYLNYNTKICPQTTINSCLQPTIEEHEISLKAFCEKYSKEIVSLLNHLDESVKLRIIHIPMPLRGDARLGILFSGGLDCTILAAIAHKYIPLDEPIDLLNVSFENPRINSQRKNDDPYMVPDRKTARQGLLELQSLFKREWRLVEINVEYKEVLKMKQHILSLIFPNNTVMDLSISLAFWFASRGTGLLDSNVYSSKAKVLFSGLGTYSFITFQEPTSKWVDIQDIKLHITNLHGPVFILKSSWTLGVSQKEILVEIAGL